MPFITFTNQEDRRYGLTLLQASLQQEYTLSWLGIQYSYLPIHLSKELNQIKAQGHYKNNACLQKDFIRQFHLYAQQYNGLSAYKKQCEHLLQEPRINGMLSFIEASPFYHAIRERMQYFFAGIEFAHFPSASLLGLFDKLINLQDYLLEAKAQLNKAYQSSQKWYYFWHRTIPKDLYREISKAIQNELNLLNQYKTAYTKTICLRLIEGASHQDPKMDDLLEGTLAILAEAGLQPCKRSTILRRDMTAKLYTEFLSHVFKYAGPTDTQKIKGLFWFRNDPNLAIPVDWTTHAFPIPTKFKSLVPAAVETSDWLSFDHNACVSIFKDSSFFIAKLNGTVEKARFSVRFHSIDLSDILHSPALIDVKECNFLFDQEIQRLEALKPSLWKRIFYLKTYGLIKAWQQHLIELKKQKITGFLCQFCVNLSTELAKMSESPDAEVKRQLNSLLQQLEIEVQNIPSLKIQLQDTKEKIEQLLNPPLQMELYQEPLPSLSYYTMHHRYLDQQSLPNKESPSFVDNSPTLSQ